MNAPVALLNHPFEGVPDWFPHWPGETCVIVASGPTAKDVRLDKARGKARFIVINDSWQLAPWADVLYACDGNWWNKSKGAMEFQGLKLTIDRRHTIDYDWGIKQVKCNKYSDDLFVDGFNRIGWGGNSGFGALNLAVQFRVKKILLVGYDMTVVNGAHWHDDHPMGMHNPTEKSVRRWKHCIDKVADKIKSVGVEVVNCSPVSTLANYRKQTFEEALGGL